MKYVFIAVPGDGLLIETAQCGPLLEALAAGQPYHRGWDGDYKPVLNELKQPVRVSVEFLNDLDLTSPPEAIQAITADLGKAKQDWLQEYTKRRAAETELATLKNDLAARGITLDTKE